MPFHEDTAEDVKREGFEIEWVKEALLNSGFAAVEIYTVVVLERERDGRNVEFPIFFSCCGEIDETYRESVTIYRYGYC